MPAELIAEVERRRAPRTTVTVRSPAAGVIDTLEVRAGMTVAAGQTLATVNGIDTVWLEAAVPEAQAAAVGVGDAVTATLAAFGGERFRGNVTALLPAADTETRTVAVRVELDNSDGRLRPGMYARVHLRGAEPPPRPLVPVEALIRTGKRTLVMKTEDDHRFRPVEIDVGREADGLAEVLNGLRSGDQVVVSGQFLIDSEASLAGVVARRAPPEPAAGTLHETDGTVVSVSGTRIELDHAAFTTMAMPAMRMTYRLADATLAAGIEPGAHVRFAVRETDEGLVVERLERIGAQP
jgi:Cu(I)/Ag(I) efflux system membrane fusion protein